MTVDLTLIVVIVQNDSNQNLCYYWEQNYKTENTWSGWRRSHQWEDSCNDSVIEVWTLESCHMLESLLCGISPLQENPCTGKRRLLEGFGPSIGAVNCYIKTQKVTQKWLFGQICLINVTTSSTSSEYLLSAPLCMEDLLRE